MPLEVMLAANFEITDGAGGGAGGIDYALASLGGDVWMNSVDVDGDVLIVDEEDGVRDYDPTDRCWKKRSGTGGCGSRYSRKSGGSSKSSKSSGNNGRRRHVRMLVQHTLNFNG